MAYTTIQLKGPTHAIHALLKDIMNRSDLDLVGLHLYDTPSYGPLECPPPEDPSSANQSAQGAEGKVEVGPMTPHNGAFDPYLGPTSPEIESKISAITAKRGLKDYWK